jgi:hypothetical protein
MQPVPQISHPSVLLTNEGCKNILPVRGTKARIFVTTGEIGGRHRWEVLDIKTGRQIVFIPFLT